MEDYCNCSSVYRIVLAERETTKPKDHNGERTDSPYSNLYCARCGTLVPVGRARKILTNGAPVG